MDKSEKKSATVKRTIKFYLRRYVLPFILFVVIVITLMLYQWTGNSKRVKIQNPIKARTKYFFQEPLIFNDEISKVAEYPQENNRTNKRILFWNDVFGVRKFDFEIGNENLFRQAGCPIWNCETSDNRTKPEKYDAIIFHQRTWSLKDLPEKRSLHQRYVFWSRESVGWRKTNTNQMTGFFNWTFTYRWDSDVVNPYGWITPVNKSNPPITLEVVERLKVETASPGSTNYAQNKTKMVAWFVSNCANHSGRDKFVKVLKKYMGVDVYGGCGNLKCPRDEAKMCRLMLERDYKFYLALENTLCADYVTEKFFDQMRYNVIPIVFDFHGHHSRFAPPHSFINAADYPTVRDLADYLKLLDKNDTLYNEYFWWKKHFVVHDNREEGYLAMCQLCALLNQNQTSPIKTYYDMTEWWDTWAECQTLKFNRHRTSWTAVPMKDILYRRTMMEWFQSMFS